jgi:hypothetical protein
MEGGLAVGSQFRPGMMSKANEAAHIWILSILEKICPCNRMDSKLEIKQFFMRKAISIKTIIFLICQKKNPNLKSFPLRT